MDSLLSFIATDRRRAMAAGESLPEQMRGTVLFVDISGFTALTEAMVRALGIKAAVDQLTMQINQVFDMLIEQIAQFGGCVVGFGGDGLTCWYNEDDGLRATASALAMQRQMDQFAAIQVPGAEAIPLALKIGLTTGTVHRFSVGNPALQLFDVVAGSAIYELADVLHHLQKGEVVVGSATLSRIDNQLEVMQWRTGSDRNRHYAVVTALKPDVESTIVALPTNEAVDLRREPSASHLRPWLLPSVYAWIAGGHGEFLTEVRPVVSLFLMFTGLDYEKDDEAGKKLDNYIRSVQQVIAAYEGSLIKLTIDDKGSYLLITFGAPVAHDDDANRALSAALDLRAVSTSYRFLQSIQIGITQGRLLAGAFGNKRRAAYDLLGNVVNMAARLMMQANPGQILTTKAVVEAANLQYQFGEPVVAQLKGIAQPVDLVELLTQTLPRTQAFSQRLFGREREVGLLQKWREQAALQQGQIIVLEGNAGIGKSHLSAEFIDQSKQAGFTVTVGYCESTNQTTAYYPWHQILHSLFSIFNSSPTAAPKEKGSDQPISIETIITSINPDWKIRLPLLSIVLDLPIPENATTEAYTPYQRQESLFAFILDLLHEVTNRQPLLLVIEDIHWLDEASLQLLVALGRVVAKMSLIILLTQRPTDGNQTSELLKELEELPGYHHIFLDELSTAELKKLVTARLPGQPSSLLLSLLRVQARCNPFYTEELLKALRELQRLVFDPVRGCWSLSLETIHALRRADCLAIDPNSGEWELIPDAPLTRVDLGTPDSLHQLILARIDRLNDETKLTLKTASVIGATFEDTILGQARPGRLDKVALQSHVDLLEQRNFIREHRLDAEQSYRFEHHMIQEVTYTSLVKEQQRQLHLAVGRAIEQFQTLAVERLVYHYSQSGDRRKTLFYLDKAARKAQKLHANRTALNYYQQALAFAIRWDWLKSMIEVLHIVGEREEERARLEELSTLPGAPEFDLAYLWGQYYQVVNDYEQAEHKLQRALTIAQEQGHLIDEVQCLSKLGWIAWKNGAKYAQAEVYYQQALDLLEGWTHYQDEEAHVLTDTLNSLGTLYRQMGRFAPAEARYQQALALSQLRKNRREEARALENLGCLADDQGQIGQGFTYHQRALRFYRVIGDRSGEGDVLHNLALGFRAQGEYRKFQENLSTVQEIRHATGNRWEEVNLSIDLGIFYHEMGDFKQAQEHLAQGLELAQKINDREGRAYLLSNLGLVLRDQGHCEAAIACLTEGLAFMEQAENQHQIAFFLSYLATVRLQIGDLQQAMDEVNRAITIRKSLSLQARTADDLATLALIHFKAGNSSQALSAAQQVWQILEAGGSEGAEFPQRDYFVCFLIFQAGHEQDEASAALHAAYRLVKERAAKIVDLDLRHSYLTQVEINCQIIEAMNH